jgi:hypothetical protein
MEAKNSQEQNEQLDRLHPEYGQYVIVNTERGIIQWYESHDAAVRDLTRTGGSIINTATAPPDLIKKLLDDARKNM